jgi:hypothetical protein
MWGVVQDMINEITTVTENVENEDFLLLKMPNNSYMKLKILNQKNQMKMKMNKKNLKTSIVIISVNKIK